MIDVKINPPASATAEGERGFTKLDYQLEDYPGPTKTVLFGIQHVLVMFTAMVGGPLIVASSLALGLGIQAAPAGAFDAVPQALKILVTDGIVMGILLAMFLNIVLPRDATAATTTAH